MSEKRKCEETDEAGSSCSFYIERKKRFCKMIPGPGRKFCVEHATTEVTEDGNRVPCPYDSKHTCYANKLQKHLKKCNARPKPLPDYMTPGVNAVDVDHPDAKKFDLDYPIGTISDETLMGLVRKIEEVFDGIPKCEESILTHKIMEETLNEDARGVSSRKHLLQNSSLIKNIEEKELLKDNMIFVEFGAGKGALTYWLAKALEDKKNCSLVLVDRASHRHKSDNKLKGTSPLDILRIRADIADLDLSKIPVLQGSEKQIVGICKHLCGMATDLALRCLISAKHANVKIKGVVMALCCHHRCTWSSFVGKDYLLEKGFDPKHFTALCSITSWATCGSGKSTQFDCDAAAANRDRYTRLSLSKDKREVIGRKCKMIMNYARLVRLERNGFSGKLVHYIDEDVSPENVCIIASI